MSILAYQPTPPEGDVPDRRAGIHAHNAGPAGPLTKQDGISTCQASPYPGASRLGLL